jgi:hypothetical protein
MGGQKELGMGARFGFAFSCSLSGTRSYHFQTARQTNSSFPLIYGTQIETVQALILAGLKRQRELE